MVQRPLRVAVVIAHGGEGVVENLVEAACREPFADAAAHAVALVDGGETALRGGNALGRLHVVVAVDAQNLLYHVARTGNVNAIARHTEAEDRVVGAHLGFHFYIQRAEDGFHQCRG